MNCTYRVKAFNSFTESSFSNEVHIHIPFDSIAAPTGLNLELNDSLYVTLNWSDNSSNESGFVIQRRVETDNEYSILDSTVANTTSFIDSTVISGETYIYSVYAFNSDTTSNLSEEASISVQTTGIRNIPSEYNNRIYPNYPNPFNPTTKIVYELGQTSDVTLNIYNILGELVYQNKIINHIAGKNSFIWNAEEYPSGIYILTINIYSSSSTYTDSRKMTLLR